MAINFETLALAKRFATSLSLGSFSNTHIEGNTIVFNMLDGTEVRYSVPQPKDGVSITNVEIDDTNHLICTMSDGNEIDAGELPSGKLKQQLTVSNEVGSAEKGKLYNIGTDFETILRDILTKEESPLLSLSIIPSKILYDKVTETLSSLTLNATCTQKTYPLSKIEFYLDSTLKDTQNISSSGTYTSNLTFTSTNNDFTVKAKVYDSKEGGSLTTEKSIIIKFVGKTYYGIVDSTVVNPTETDIKTLSNTLKDVKGYVYNNITMEYGKVVYAYPKSFGELESIKDEKNNFTYYPGNFTKLNVTIDSIPYLVYISNEAAQSENLQLVFK